MSCHEPRIGYVLKMYPRFSETFIVNEVLALEAMGADLEVFSLRLPADGRFHAELASVRAPVTYLDQVARTGDLWQLLRSGHTALAGGLDVALDALLAAEPRDAAQAVHLALLARERGIDHLHAHFGSVATTVARLAGRLAGIGYSFTAHAKDIFHADVDAEDFRSKLADAATVVTVSDFNAAYLRTTYGEAAARVRRVYNGLDLTRFEFRPSPAAAEPVVVGLGRLVEKKGWETLVDAVLLLVRGGRRLRLDLVGAGPLEDELRTQAHRLGVGARVRFRGPLPQDQVRSVVGQATVLAAPCVVAADGNRDGLPTVVLEALALGTPVVATPVTGISEAVVDGRTGLLVPERDAPSLAAAIDRLLDDPELRVELARAGRRHVEEVFDVRRTAAELHDVLTAASGRQRVVT